MLKTILSLAFMLCLGIHGYAQKNKKGLSLNDSYEQFVNNIKNRDFARAKTYVHTSDSIQFSDAGGNVMLSMDAYFAQLKKFMDDKGWKSYKSNIISSKQYDDTGIIMENAVIAGENWEFKMIVTYVFQNIDGYWKLVADVCTKIES